MRNIVIYFLSFLSDVKVQTYVFNFYTGSVSPNEDQVITDYRIELVLNLSVLGQWREADYENGSLASVLADDNSNHNRRHNRNDRSRNDSGNA